MKSKSNIRQSGVVLLIALMLAAFTLSGLNAYVLAEDAQTEVQAATQADLPKDSAVDIVWETYDNYPNDDPQLLEEYYQGFGLTQKEKNRVMALKEAFTAGMRPKGKVSSVPEETGFAVVALNPADFAGMEEYFFLPCRELSDEELLQLIAYGEEKGRPFTGETLSVKNCMRGGAMEVNRMRSAGEDARRTILFKRFSQEGLRSESLAPAADTSPISTITDIRVNPDANYGLDSFRLYPIREATDEEILADLTWNNGGNYLDPVKEGLDLAADTAKARKLLEDVLGMTLATEANRLCYARGEEDGKVHLYATFDTPKINGLQTSYSATVVVQSGQCLRLNESTMDDSLYRIGANGILEYGPGPYVQEHFDINDERLVQSAQAAVEKLTAVKATKVETMARATIGNVAGGAYVAVQMEDGTAYQVTVWYSDFSVCGLEYFPEGLKTQEPVNN